MSIKLDLIFLQNIVVPKSAIIVLASILFLTALAAILFLADKFLKLKAKESGVSEDSISIFPKVKDSILGAAPSFTMGGDVNRLSKGYDLKLKGKVESDEIIQVKGSRYAVSPLDFRYLSPIPKVVKAVGEEIKAGEVLFYDKKNPDVKFVSPVSGEIIELNRGEKRKITDVVILADKEQKYQSFDLPALSSDRADLVSFLVESGVWPFLIQRPFGVIADHTEVPRDIYVSTFDTAPLAVDSNLVLGSNKDEFAKGVELLSLIHI